MVIEALLCLYTVFACMGWYANNFMSIITNQSENNINNVWITHKKIDFYSIQCLYFGHS